MLGFRFLERFCVCSVPGLEERERGKDIVQRGVDEHGEPVRADGNAEQSPAIAGAGRQLRKAARPNGCANANTSNEQVRGP
jgi:hypothetical protein